jgi:WD40 repeat protein
MINLVEDWRELQLAWQGQLDDLVTVLVCAPNGRGWVASSARGELVWNAGLLDLVQLQAADGQSIDSTAFSTDSRWLAAGGQAGEVLIWDCTDANLPPQFAHKLRIGRWIEHLVWHPIEPYLAVSYGAQVQVWDIPTMTAIATWKFAKSSIFDLAWHQAGKYLAMAGYQGVQIETLQPEQPPTQRISVATASIKLAWSHNGRYLVAGNLDRTLTIIDWQNPQEQWTLTGCPGKIRQILWVKVSSNPCLAVASGTAIVLWQLNPDTMTWEGLFLEGHQDTVAALAVHPSQPIIGSGSLDGYTCLWSAQGEIGQIIVTDHAPVTTLAWHLNADYLLTGSQLGSIGLWQIQA